MSGAKPDKRQKIMDAVEHLFTRRRFHEVTLDQVAQKAGVGKGTIYLYFKDKENLFFQTAISGFDELCSLLKRKVSGSSPFHDQLQDACAEIISFFSNRKQLLRMIQNDEPRMRWQQNNIRNLWLEKRQNLIDALSHIIGRGIKEKRIRADVSADILAKFLLSMLRTRVRDLADAPPEAQKFELLLDIFLHGVARTKKEHASES